MSPKEKARPEDMIAALARQASLHGNHLQGAPSFPKEHARKARQDVRESSDREKAETKVVESNLTIREKFATHAVRFLYAYPIAVFALFIAHGCERVPFELPTPALVSLGVGAALSVTGVVALVARGAFAAFVRQH